MRLTSASRGVIQPLVVTILILATVQLDAWNWPVTGRSITIHSDSSDALFHDPGIRAFRFVNRSGGDMPVIAPISGEVIFFDTADVSGPQEGEVLVIRDANELWVILRLYGMTWPESADGIAGHVGTGDVLGRADAVELEIYDRLAQRYVNPRALFPFTDQLPRDGLPPFTFLQNGMPTGPDMLTPGTVQIVVAREDIQFSRLPQRVYVLRDGLLQTQYSFMYRDDTSALTTPKGDLLLFEANVATGLNEIEFEAQRFDGTVERQTVRLFVPDPPLDTP